MKKQVLVLFSILLFGVSLEAQTSGDSVIIFAIIGDFGSNDSNERFVSNMVKSWNPDFIVTVGDNSYDNDEGENLKFNVGDYYGDYIYNPAYDKANTNKDGRAYKEKKNLFFTCLGNHDSKTEKSLENYQQYFNAKNNYSLTWGPVSLYFFDSGKDSHNNGNGKFSDATLQTIRTWLHQPNPDNNFRLVFFHHPPHTCGAPNPRITSMIDFDTLHVDAVITGHEHLYERLKHTNNQKLPLYVVCGSGGANLTEDKYIDQANTGPDFSNVVFDNKHFGAIKASIITTGKVKTIYFEYYIVDGKGSRLEDRYYIQK